MRHSIKMAKIIGRGSVKILYTSKGLEIAGHSARGIPHMALAYATSTRGGSHHDTRPKYYEPAFIPDPDEIVSYCIENQHYTAVGDSLVMCRFIMERGFGKELNRPLCRIVNSVTGFDLSVDELEKIGERIYNLERAVNVSRGVNRKSDRLPYRITGEPVPDGPSKGMYCSEEKLGSLLEKYYARRGWDSNGIASEETN